MSEQKPLKKDEVQDFAAQTLEVFRTWDFSKGDARAVCWAMLRLVDIAPSWKNPLEGTGLRVAPGTGGIRNALKEGTSAGNVTPFTGGKDNANSD